MTNIEDFNDFRENLFKPKSTLKKMEVKKKTKSPMPEVNKVISPKNVKFNGKLTERAGNYPDGFA